MPNDMKALPAEIIRQMEDIGGGLTRRVLTGHVARFAITANFRERIGETIDVEKLPRERPGIAATVEIVHHDHALGAATVKFMTEDHRAALP